MIDHIYRSLKTSYLKFLNFKLDFNAQHVCFEFYIFHKNEAMISIVYYNAFELIK